MEFTSGTEKPTALFLFTVMCSAFKSAYNCSMNSEFPTLMFIPFGSFPSAAEGRLKSVRREPNLAESVVPLMNATRHIFTLNRGGVCSVCGKAAGREEAGGRGFTMFGQLEPRPPSPPFLPEDEAKSFSLVNLDTDSPMQGGCKQL